MPLRAAITQLYGYIYCMILSSMLTDMPIFGGVLYLCGKAVIVFSGIIGKDRRFTLSGRTAIYYCLKNIICKRKIMKAYVPSYCCDSMIEPFLEFGIEIEYYRVYFDGGLKYDIEIREDVDLFLAMNYFGYSSTNMDQYIKKYKEQGTIVLEDITHSMFSTKRYSENSDYLIGSLRKWMPVLSGGIAISMNWI